jgi:type II secretory pathway predicted ATPase ExeA
MHTAASGLYRRHFGLNESLFTSGIALNTQVFLGPSQSRLIGRLALALGSHESVAVIVGRPGIGKTTLVRAAAAATSEDHAIVWIGMRPDNARELLDLLLIESTQQLVNVGQAERIQAWRRLVDEHRFCGKPTYVLVENAQDWSLDALRSLDALTSSEANGSPDVNVILMGTNALLNRLQDERLEPLRQRVQMCATLEPMTAEVMREFLDARVARAGADPKEIFGPGAAELIHSYAGGIPRVAQNICASAFYLAATRDEHRISAQTVRDVAVDMHGVRRGAGIHSILDASGARVNAHDGHAADQGALDTAENAVPTLTDVVVGRSRA